MLHEVALGRFPRIHLELNIMNIIGGQPRRGVQVRPLGFPRSAPIALSRGSARDDISSRCNVWRRLMTGHKSKGVSPLATDGSALT